MFYKQMNLYQSSREPKKVVDNYVISTKVSLCEPYLFYWRICHKYKVI